MNVYVTELEKWVESGLSKFEIRRLVAEIYFNKMLFTLGKHTERNIVQTERQKTYLLKLCQNKKGQTFVEMHYF